MATTAEDAAEAAELEVPEEVWRRRGRQRQRQIDIGKARPEYQNMQSAKPGGNPPMTPDPHARISKRAFDRLLSNWRRRLHEFDDDKVGESTHGEDISELPCPLKDHFGQGPISGSATSCLSPENLAYACTPSTRADSEELSPPLNLNLQLAELLQPPAQAQALTTTPSTVGSVVAPRWTSNVGAGSPMHVALMPAQMMRAGPTATGLQPWQAAATMRQAQPAMMALPQSYLWAAATPCAWQPAVASQQTAPCSGVAQCGGFRSGDVQPSTLLPTGSYAPEVIVSGVGTALGQSQGGLLVHQEASSPAPSQPMAVSISAAPWPPATWGGLGGLTASIAGAGDVGLNGCVARTESPARTLNFGPSGRGAESQARPPRSPPQPSSQEAQATVASHPSAAGRVHTSPARRSSTLRQGDPSEEAPTTPPKKQFGISSPHGRFTPQQGSPVRPGGGCAETPSPQQQVETPSPQQMQASHYRHYPHSAAMTPASMGHAALTPAHAAAMTPAAASQMAMVHTTQAVHIAWRGPVTPVHRSPFYAVGGAAASGVAAGPAACGAMQCYASGTPVLPFAASPGDFHMCRPATYIQTPAPAPPLPCGNSASPPLHRHHGASHGLTPGPSRVSLCGEDTAACMAEWRRSDV